MPDKKKFKDIAHLLIGEFLGLSQAIVFYYYGTSRSSAKKTDILDKKI